MSRATSSLKKVGFQDPMGDRAAIGYSPMRATNFNTGVLQEVVLVEPHTLQDHVAVDSLPELRADLNSAFSQFSKVQQRVLFRVLVQGQSIETATRDLQRSHVFWWAWLNKTALPKLRSKLADYMEGGKLVIG